MRKSLYLILAVLVAVAVSHDAAGQMNRRNIKKNNKRISSYRGVKKDFGKEKRYNSLGISLNALNYYGDLAPKPGRLSTDLSLTRPALGVSFAHRFGPRYTLQASFAYGTLRGEDAKSADPFDMENAFFRYQRNLSFRNRIKELSVVGVFDLFKNQSTYISRVSWTPYAFAGLAAFHHNPQAQAPEVGLNGQPLPQAGQWVNLRTLGTEGQYATLEPGDVNFGIKPYKSLQIAIPFGLGVRFRLNEVVDLSAEVGFRYLFTDYIDDVSANYVDLGVFGDNELARALSYRSNEIATPNRVYQSTRDGRTYSVVSGYGEEYPDNMRGSKSDNDTYMMTTIRLTYILGKNFHRAKFR